MNPKQLYISTVASDAAQTAQAWGLGVEIAEYCTASRMDDGFRETDAALRETLEGIPNRIFHAPFNELFPCAIDPQARELAAYRYWQAIHLAKSYGAEKIVIHGGYIPKVYFPQWYTEQSVLFWQEFLQEDPGIPIVLENVMEEAPELLTEILRQVDHPNLRMCLDVGHGNVCSQIPVIQWLERCAPWISHFHIHNNDGAWDTHSALDQGNIPMRELLNRAEILCPEATFTLEVTQAMPSVRWLLEE